jgi:hypothetical protein
MTDPDRPEHDGMEMVLPFVVVTSVGGPYDDESFAAGWQCGEIDRALAVAAVTGATTVHFPIFRTSLQRQVDLIAMKHGFASVVVEPSGEWPEWSALTVSMVGES